MIGSIVTTTKGHLQGTMDNDICVWRGVRYAKAPVAALRFRSPEPVEKWSGVSDAVEFGAIPPQPSSWAGTEKMDEDCLFLNIWSPRADDKKRPVMVWIPGGAYISGAGSIDQYDGHVMAKNGDVVVVSINYRSGALGFLDFTEEDDQFETNLGLRDQVASLRWIKENIEVFGGDPENVTIFGQLSGGNAVTTLLTVPSARGLFQKAIAESPTPTSVYRKGMARQVSEKFLQILGIGKEEINRLKTLPAADIVVASSRLLKENSQAMPGLLPFGPVVDGDFLPDYPLDSIRSKKTERIPLLIGTNQDDMSLFVPTFIPTNAEMIDEMFKYTDPEAKERIKYAYWCVPEKEALLDIGRDATYLIPSILYAEAYSRLEKTWMYRFDAAIRLSKRGMMPRLERPFAFRTFGATLVKRINSERFRPTAHKVSNRISNHWLNFARYGDPNPPEGEIWPKYNEVNRYTMIFNKRDYIEKDPNRMIRLAWEGAGIYK
ncbi:carboxylesterase/lipase family protein [Peribacillus muralis]|uniref:carboxylesterase/lipase family protein n=1 Tax=Peribacillus muralis TaxID=264697 RepID=UPI001F4EDDD2|nr:carboxylesterase/lipase family protein [Peribacillus muralis]MCK1992781.1 carboxylesterase/lipase family protein [Peribacillus muralis]MCK2013336.1 carboxylesterase/lipase family protein [Peribacillus muralis]